MGFQMRRKPTRRFQNPEKSGDGLYTPIPGHAPWPWKERAPPECLDFSGEGWIEAPASSHLRDFRFVYGLDSLQVEGDRLGVGGIKFHRRVGRSFLQIRYRANNDWAVFWSVPDSGFTAEKLEFIYLVAVHSASPGTVFWKELIGPSASVCWPYDTSR